MLNHYFKTFFCTTFLLLALFGASQAAADTGGYARQTSTEDNTVDALGDEDTKFYYESVLIDFPKENKRSVMRLKGAHWEADATDGQGRVLSRNAFVWKGGSAIFDKNGKMSNLHMRKTAKTVRGLSIGSSVTDIQKLYSDQFQIYADKFGPQYRFRFQAHGKNCSLILATNTSTGKVTEIMLLTDN